MQIFGHFYQFLWADLWTLGQNRGQVLLPIVSGKVENIGMPTSKPEKKEPKKPLSVTHPELAKEADGWDPSTVSGGLSKKMKWRCPEQHTYESVINKRTSRGDGCPYCSRHKVIKGITDLMTTHPDLAKQADGWDPGQFSQGSNKNVSWECELGHSWKAVIAYRSRFTSKCPFCSNKKLFTGFNDLESKNNVLASQAYKWDPTKYIFNSASKKDWQCESGHIWSASIGDRSKGTGCPICINQKLLIGFNDLKTRHPEIAAEADGWDPSTFIFGSEVKKSWACKIGHKWISKISERTKGTGCPFCAGQKVSSGFNDLQFLNPSLASEASGWDPSRVTLKSGLKKNWICSLGHQWEATIHHRANGTGCPVCSNQKVLIGFNDLKTTDPKIAAEADGWDPISLTRSSGLKRSWKCTSGHTWSTRVTHRTSGIGCPSCAKYGFDPNKDGYLYFLSHSDWEMFQIGITNVPDDRVGRHEKTGWEVLGLRGPMDGHLTQQWETAILRMLKKKGADLSNEKIAGKFDGYSEAWTKATFPVDSIKELMRLTDEYEERKIEN